VLSYLPAKQAGELLAALPAGRRAAALERLADLGESDRTSLEVIEKGLADWISTRKAEQRRRADRLSAVKSILEHSTQEASTAVLAEIAGRDRELANRLGGVPSPASTTTRSTPTRSAIAEQAASLTGTRGPSQNNFSHEDDGSRQLKPLIPPPIPTFEFSQLASLSRDEIGELFQQCEADCMVLALAGASEEVTSHIEGLLPRGVAKELRRRVNHLSAVRLSDVTAAQQKICEIAGRLFTDSRVPTRRLRHSQPAIPA
jgi:flagellar motor switch protein FliG